MQPPPPEFVPYPRGDQYGSAEKLRLLQKAYYGAYWIVASTLGTAFLAGIAAFVVGFVTRDANSPVLGLVVVLAYVAIFAVNFVIGFKYGRLVAEAKDREAGYAVILGIFASLLSPCCIGAVGSAVIQQAVANELKKYGLKVGFLGLRKEEVEAKIASYSQYQQPS